MKKNYLRIAAAAVVFAFASAAGVAAQVPDWAEGTFQARNPQTGGTIILTINPNGNVTVNMDGNISYGTYRNERLRLGGVTSRVSRIGNGIRTTRTDNGERIDYYRSGAGYPGYPDGGTAYPGGNVDNWAVGTFTGRNPQTGGTIYLRIASNGVVTANMDGFISQGIYDNSRITIDGVTSRVTRRGNGIRTVRLDNRERIDYNRYSGSVDWNRPDLDDDRDWDQNRRSNPPSWAVGTFYGRNPQTGGTITLTLTREGRVVAEMEGPVMYGNYYNGWIYVGGARSRVSEINGGIRTTRRDTGERIDYYRYGGSTGSWTGGNVPDWAVGNFYARNPQTGGTIYMTIERNGNVYVNFDGATTYGSIYRDRLTIGGITSDVDRTSRGIRTTRLDNRERIEYIRRN